MPPLGEATARSDYWGFGAARQESLRLASQFQTAARLKGVAFLDAGTVIESSPLDGVHLDAEAHERLGRAVAGRARELLG